MTEGYEPSEDLAEVVDDGSYAIVSSGNVGLIGGLVWEDRSGVDVIAVRVDGADIAVPVEHGYWRYRPAVDLGITLDVVSSGPTVRALKSMSADDAINVIGEHYDITLNGPPPGPGTTPLPPWWPGPTG